MEDTVTIAHIFEDMNNGDPITAVEGVLIKCYAPLQAGKGTLQNGTLLDDEGSEGKITFSDTTVNDKTAVNQRIRIESVSNARGRTGLKVKDDDKYGRAIWVTGSAKITFPGGGDHRGNAPSSGAPAGKPTFKRGGAAAPKPQENKVNSPQRGPQRNPEERLGDLSDLLSACAEHVKSKVMSHFLVDENQKPENYLQAQHALVSTLFIQCDRAGVTAGWVDRSNRPLPRPPEDPTQWKQCYVNSKGSKMHGKTLDQIASTDLLELFNYCDSKQLNTPFAECVYKAALDRNVIPQHKEEPPEELPLKDPEPGEEDDVPF